MNGMIETEERGRYTFFVLTDGGVRLWINGKLVIDEWNNKENTRFETHLSLRAHKKYCFRLEHRQLKPNTANLKINWYPPQTDAHPLKINAYLPKDGVTAHSSQWFDFWTGKKLSGGRHLLVRTPIDMIPLYVPAGSIIPMGPVVQYATELPAAPIEVRVYPGRNAAFKLYEDEGDTYDYEKGAYSIITFIWDQSTKTLTIGDREGEFPGMVESREFDIVLVRNGHGVGVGSTTKPDKIIRYEGKKIQIKL